MRQLRHGQPGLLIAWANFVQAYPFGGLPVSDTPEITLAAYQNSVMNP